MCDFLADLTLDRVLQMIARLERSPLVSSAARKNLVRLTSSLNAQKVVVTDHHTNQVQTQNTFQVLLSFIVQECIPSLVMGNIKLQLATTLPLCLNSAHPVIYLT